MLFWSTKSLVQPRGKLDEWHQLQQMPQVLTTSQLLYVCTSKAASKDVWQTRRVAQLQQIPQVKNTLTL